MLKFLVSLLIVLLSACQADLEIVSGLSEADANEVLVVLDSQKINAIKTASQPKQGSKAPTYSVQVAASKASEALRILVDNRLPTPKSPGLGEVYPSDSSSLIPSQMEEKAKFLRATQGEIENMLKVLPGVIEARVIVVLPDQNVVRDLHGEKPKATASVAIVYNPVDSKGTHPVKPEEVKYLVASAVSDLSPAAVTVLMSKNHSSTLMGLPKLIKKSVKKIAHPAQVKSSRTLVRDEVLVWVFGVLAFLGVLLGIFGLMRNKSLRGQLKKALESRESHELNESSEGEESRDAQAPQG